MTGPPITGAPMSETGPEGLDAPRVVLTTAPDAAAALALARALVESRAAACVNLVPGITSVYRWKGAIEEAAEVLLVAKTTQAGLPLLERALEGHPYDVPECVVLAPARVEARYLDWLRAESGPVRDTSRAR